MIPVGMAAAGWAAISAVGGALVGATAGGLVDFLITQHRDKNLARTAARLVLADLSKCEDTLRTSQKSKEWRGGKDMRIAAWEEFQAVLAGPLHRKDFQLVSRGIAIVRSLAAVNSEGDGSLTDETVEVMADFRRELAYAYNALAEIADLDKVGEFINEASVESALENAEATEGSGSGP